MPIKLLSSAGPFDPAFIDALSGLEAGLIASGLDPAMFTVSRAEAFVCLSDSLGDTDPIGYEYTVYAGAEHYIAIMPNDFSFLNFLAECCTALAAEEAERATSTLLVTTMPTRTTARFAERLHRAA